MILMKMHLALVAPLILLAAGCAGESTTSPTNSEVLTSLYPLQFVAERVAGGDADVVNLTSPGAEPHDLELTAKQVAEFSEAGVVLYIHGFQPAVDEAVEQAKPDHAIDLLDEIDPLEASDAEDAHEHEDEGEHADEHDHGSTDPHLWLDPKNLVIAAKAVSSALGDLDPAHVDGYMQRADKLIAELNDLDDEFTTGLKTCERRVIVTAHAAFGYLARAYDLEQIAIAGIDPSQEPSTSDLARIAEEVEHEKVTTIFTERLVSPAVAQAVARETGATTAVLDPIEGLSDETSGEDYLSLMRANLSASRTANDCS
jgi:zinc transport system substrate-binding protein